MSANTVYIYADASFSKEKEIGIIGFVIFKSTEEHNAVIASELKLHFKTISESNNIRAEIIGVIEALEYCSTSCKINLYSDCQTVTNLLLRREKLESTAFISQTKQRLLANADIYKKFYEVWDKFNPQIYWVKGHTSGTLQTKIQKNFSYVDKEVRKELRKII